MFGIDRLRRRPSPKAMALLAVPLQLNKPWGQPKNEQCKGFTIAEFQRLDLSRMDFTEVYADFLDAAKLPDEVQTMTEIQQKIQNYYDLHGGRP